MRLIRRASEDNMPLVPPELAPAGLPTRPLQDQMPGTSCRRMAEKLREGRLPDSPVIFPDESGPSNLLMIEGHKWPTGLMACPQWLPVELHVMRPGALRAAGARRP